MLANSALAVPAPATAVPVVYPVSGTSSLMAVSCPPAGACLAVGQGMSPVAPVPDGMIVVVGRHIGPGEALPSQPVVTALGAVSCPRRAACRALGPTLPLSADELVTVLGAHRAAEVPLTGMTLGGGISCPSFDICTAAGGAAFGAPSTLLVSAITNGLPTGGVTPPGFGFFEGVSCRTVVCWAVGQASPTLPGSFGGTLFRVAGGTPGPLLPVAASDLHGISCGAPDACLAVGTNGFGVLVPVTRDHPGAPVTVSSASTLNAVSCATAVRCLAVGQMPASGGLPAEGVAVPVIGGLPQAPVPVPGSSTLLGVACRGHRCVAVGIGGPAGNLGVVVTALH